MKKLIISIFCTLISYSISFGQDSLLTDLKAKLDLHPSKDTVRIQLLYNYANLLKRSNRDSALFYAKQAVQWARTLKSTEALAYCLALECNLNLNLNKYDSASASGLEALRLAERFNNSMLLSNLQFDLSEVYRMTGKNINAEHHALEYLELARKQKSDEMILTALVQLHNIYYQMKASDKVTEYYDQAMKLAIALNSQYSIARLLEFDAFNQLSQGNTEEAITSFRKILHTWMEEKNYPAIAWIQANLSYSFLKLANRDSAGFYAYAALETAKQKNLKKELSDAYHALFQYHQQIGDYKKALDFRLSYDSLNNETYNMQSGETIERERLKYEQEKKDELSRAEQALRDSNTKRTRNFQYFIIGIFVIIAGFLFWNNRQKQQAKLAIEKAYTELRSTQSQLIQSEKMASLGELTAGIAHEIQNPLNFVNNFSDVNKELIEELKGERLKAKDERDEKLEEEIFNDLSANLDKISHHGRRAEAIVKNMLQHTRQTSSQKELTDVNALADEYMRLSYHGLRAKDNTFNATMNMDLDPDLPKINMVPQEIGRVLLNLFNNAFYAVAERSRQENIQGLEPKYAPAVSLTTKRTMDHANKNWVEIRVSDNGNGIPPDLIDKIFQPFYTTKPAGQGTGLGLSLSYDIVTKGHGGRIKVDTHYSSPNEDSTTEANHNHGSTFIIQLPIN